MRSSAPFVFGVVVRVGMGVGIALAGLTVAGSARAQAVDPRQNQTAAARKTAQEHLTKGLALYRRAEITHDPALYEATYLEYLQAYTVYPSSDSALWNLCLIESDTRRFVESLRHLREFERRTGARENHDHPKHEAFVKVWDEAFAKTGHVEIAAPSGALVVLDGKYEAGVAPLAEPVDVTVGKHLVEARVGEYVRRAQVDAPAAIVVTSTLPDVTTQLVGARPAADDVSPPGAIPAPSEAERSAPPPREAVLPNGGTHSKPIVIASMGGAAAVAVAFGVYFALDAGGATSKAADIRNGQLGGSTTACAPGAIGANTNACSNLRDQQTRHDTDTQVSAALFAAGGALVVGAVAVAYLWKSPDHMRAAMWLAPLVATRQYGLGLAGRF